MLATDQVHGIMCTSFTWVHAYTRLFVYLFQYPIYFEGVERFILCPKEKV